MILPPALCFIQHRRWHAALVAAGYYGGASSLLIPASKAFFGPSVTLAESLALWTLGTALLASPFALLWSANRMAIAWRLPVAIVASVPPPLGIVGWASPLTAAGVLFPGSGWAGIVLLLAAGVALCMHKSAVLALLALAAVFNLSHPGLPTAPRGWQGMDTRFGGLGFEGTPGLEEFRAARQIQRRADVPARVVAFPETAIPSWTEATDLLWHPFLRQLANQGKTIVVGARFPRGSGIENGLVLRGAENGTFLQRIPVPFGMWLPFGSQSATMRPFGPAMIRIAGETVAPLICYEQFLTWPILTAALHRPTVLFAPSNLYWAKGTQMRARQRALVRAWSRLFSIGVVAAVNE
jgi:hypothetical protein